MKYENTIISAILVLIGLANCGSIIGQFLLCCGLIRAQFAIREIMSQLE